MSIAYLGAGPEGKRANDCFREGAEDLDRRPCAVGARALLVGSEPERVRKQAVVGGFQ
jgi:hypothetical protein